LIKRHQVVDFHPGCVSQEPRPRLHELQAFSTEFLGRRQGFLLQSPVVEVAAHDGDDPTHLPLRLLGKIAKRVVFVGWTLPGLHGRAHHRAMPSIRRSIARKASSSTAFH
jgi:hypothetical protein